MSFCNNTCCFDCDEKNCLPINLCGYHKACKNHLISLKNDMHHKCRKCHSRVLIIKNLFICENYENHIKNEFPCGHIICPSCNEFCLNCYCICRRKLTKSLNDNTMICSSCESNKFNSNLFPKNQDEYSDCPNCRKKSIPCELRCKHLGCAECLDTNDCLRCINSDSNMISDNKCQNCNRINIEKIKLNCKEHYGCLHCMYLECRKCEHEIKLCSNCSKERTIIKAFGCNHEGCDNCYKEGCIKCKVVREQNIYESCSRCNENSLNLLKLQCGHKLCQSCKQKNQNCDCKLQKDKGCIYCKKVNTDFKSIDCTHKLCINCSLHYPNCNICFNKNPKILNNAYCCGCRELKENLMALSCTHKICISCYSHNKKCNLCKEKCTVCNLITENLINRKCLHKICKNCFDAKEKCRICPEKSSERCCCCKNFCSNSVELNCKHKSCFVCLQNNNACKNCVDAEASIKKYCINCEIYKEKVHKINCGHNLCADCIRDKKVCSRHPNYI